MHEIPLVIGIVVILAIWILIEVKGRLWMRITSVCVATFLIWNIASIAASVIPSKEKRINAASFERIETMIDQGRNDEALIILRDYLKDYQTDSYQAAVDLYRTISKGETKNTDDQVNQRSKAP